MTHIVERLLQLERFVAHLRSLRPRVGGPESLERDLTLHNDVMYSLLQICQLVVDISGELAAREGRRFGDYTEAVRGLAADSRFPAALVDRLARLPGFRNVLVHEYVQLDYRRVIEALDDLGPIEEFAAVVRTIEAGRA